MEVPGWCPHHPVHTVHGVPGVPGCDAEKKGVPWLPAQEAPAWGHLPSFRLLVLTLAWPATPPEWFRDIEAGGEVSDSACFWRLNQDQTPSLFQPGPLTPAADFLGGCPQATVESPESTLPPDRSLQSYRAAFKSCVSRGQPGLSKPLLLFGLYKMGP